MSVAQDILSNLSRLDVKIEVIGDQLRIDAPKGVLNEALKQELMAHKPELLSLLKTSDFDIQQAPHNAVIPLASSQERLWTLIELQHDHGIYNVPMVFRLRGSLNIDTLVRSLDTIQTRHSILRTSFQSVRGRAQQRTLDTASFAPVITDLTHLADADQSRAVDGLLEAEVQKRFDLNKPPLWRCALFVLSSDEHVLMFTMHHIVFDLSSKTLFLRELEALYAGDPVQVLPIQYRDYANWQQSDAQLRRASTQLDYWKTKLDGTTVELLLPTDRPRPTATKMAGGSRSFAVSMEVARKLSSIGRAARCTSYMTLLAAFHALLHRYTGQTDQIVCSPIACRNKRDVESLIGYFNNIVPMRTDLSGDPSFRELLGRVREVTMDAMKHQDAPFQQINDLACISGTPLTRGMFNFRGEYTPTLNLKGLSAIHVELRRAQADFDLALYMGIENGDLAGVLDYNAEIFEDQTIAKFLDDFTALLETVAGNPDLHLSELSELRRKFPDIEEALREHPKVDEVVVVVRSDARGSNRVIYLVLNEDDLPSQAELKAVVDERLLRDQGPLVFVPLDELPTSPVGTVDLAALPAPTLSRTSVGNKYVAPRTPLEEHLAEIWQHVLWNTEKVGIHDNFFDLGGHSLLSVQLILEIEVQLDVSVPLESLVQLSTIAEFAELLERSKSQEESPVHDGLSSKILHQLQTYTIAWGGVRARPNSLITGLNTGGRERPVFWVVQRYLQLSQLAKHLGPQQPIYGLRSGHKVMGYSREDARVLGRHYVNEIIEIQNCGPFIVGGVCQASEIAFEIASQLLDIGLEVNLLCLQERFIRQDYPGQIAFLFGDVSDRNPYYHFARPELGWGKYYTGGFKVHTIRGAHGAFFAETNIQSLTDEMRLAFKYARSKTPCSSHGTTMQRLSESAYRAKLSVAMSTQVAPDRNRLAIIVTNLSGQIWRASNCSGVYLGARWLNPNSRDVKGHDRFMHSTQIRAPLTAGLGPGETIELEFDVTIPEGNQLHVLEIDMVDEGITWFADMGSEAVRWEIQNRYT